MLLDAAALIYATRRTRRLHRGSSSSSRLSRIDDVTELLRISDATVTKRYDTIRYAVLTCARKPTQVSLIYRTEPTTKEWRREKLKS